MILTASNQTHIRKDAEGLQVHAFMTKPMSPNILLSTLKEIFQSQL